MQIILFVTLSLCILAQIMAKKNMRFTPVVKDTIVNDVMTVQTFPSKPKWVKFSVFQVMQKICDFCGAVGCHSTTSDPHQFTHRNFFICNF